MGSPNCHGCSVASLAEGLALLWTVDAAEQDAFSVLVALLGAPVHADVMRHLLVSASDFPLSTGSGRSSGSAPYNFPRHRRETKTPKGSLFYWWVRNNRGWTLIVPATVGSRDGTHRGRGLPEKIGTPSCTGLTARRNVYKYVPLAF
jgi:hypothetical protein